ncbi:MAG: hypothetical protein ABI222_07480 [Opitutaceae bacterium]
MTTPRHPLLALLPALALLLLPACQGPDHKAMMEEVRHSIPPMSARANYFGDQIAVHLTLGANLDRNFRPDNPLDGTHDDSMRSGLGSGQLGSSMGEGSFGAAGAPRASSTETESLSNDGENSGNTPRRGAKGGTYQGNKGMRGESDESDDDGPRSRNHNNDMPAALMRLHIHNMSQATVVVEVREVNSELGNFAVRPSEITLKPGETIEVEPMQSMLGVDTFELPVKISLRAGGVVESQTLILRPVKPATTTPPAASGPSPTPTR